MITEVTWIKSAGGPLICIDAILQKRWRGIAGSSITQSESMARNKTDYERACAVTDYVGKLDIDGGDALIFGDMPLETTFFSLPEVTIVRVFYADPHTDFAQMLLGLGEQVFLKPIESTVYTTFSGNMLVFDSANSGDDGNMKVVRFDLEKGTYKVLTATAEPDARTSLLMHRFFPLN